MAKVRALEGDIGTFANTMLKNLDERQRRLFLASFAEYLGYGGATKLSEVTGVTQQTISAGKKDLRDSLSDDNEAVVVRGRQRVRAEGGGRKSILEKNPEIVKILEGFLDSSTVGNPENPLKWTVKSTRTLSKELESQGIKVSYTTVGRILEEMGFTLQQNKKYTESGRSDPDRNAQFEFISSETARFMKEGMPVISVDAKKKENVGNFKNAGSEYRRKYEPRLVNDHDFCSDHAIPYGIYDIGANEGFVSVGISADTAEFAVESIGNWWHLMGKERYPDAKDVMITCDGGGSNGCRVKLWKVKLQELADFTGLTFHVSHFPPGTSKWNKIEHSLFSYITRNWKGQPLENYEIIVNLIGATTNSKGLKVKCIIDSWEYERGIQISDDQMDDLNLVRNEWRGDWNYSIAPR